MAVRHPRFESPNEVLRWVQCLEMTPNGIFKQVVSISDTGVLAHRKERFLTWTQSASGEPINLAIGTLGWRRSGSDQRFDLSAARLTSGEEFMSTLQRAGLRPATQNSFVALPIDGDTTLLVDSVTFIERVLLQHLKVFDLATSPFRASLVECRTKDNCTVLRPGPLALKSDAEGILRRGAVNGGLLRLITWLECGDWQTYFGTLLRAIRQGSPLPLPTFKVSGWLRFDGMRIDNVVLVEYMCGIVDQINRPRRITYTATRVPLAWRPRKDFPRLKHGDIDFDEPYDYEPV